MSRDLVRTASGRLITPADAPQIACLAQTRSSNERLKAQLQLTLPPNWEVKLNPEGKPYYVDHNTRTTHWAPPEAAAPPPFAPSMSPEFVSAAIEGTDMAAAIEHAECCICCE